MRRRSRPQGRPAARSAPGLPVPLLLALFAAAVLAGCEWGLGVGGGPLDPEIRGRYDGTFFVEWDDFRHRGWDEGPGTIRIRRTLGDTFEGRWEWWLGGRRLEGELERGRGDRRGRLSFRLESWGRDLMEALTDCRLLSGDFAFHGELRGRFLRADRSGRLRCRDPFTGRAEDVHVRITFRGRR